MTPQEFKAWFEGFTEAFDRLPTKAQWARVKERVAEIDGKPVTERIYLDRYWPYYPPYQRYGVINTTVPTHTTFVGNVASTATAQLFNSTDAMYAIGKADAMSLTEKAA